MRHARWDRESLRDLSADDILESLGLMRTSQQPSWLWPAVGGMAVGIFTGIALGMAYAPKRGRELRHEIGDKLRSRDMSGLAQTAREAVSSARS